MPDLSHLTAEERQIIESVLLRQREEEEKEQEILRSVRLRRPFLFPRNRQLARARIRRVSRSETVFPHFGHSSSLVLRAFSYYGRPVE